MKPRKETVNVSSKNAEIKRQIIAIGSLARQFGWRVEGFPDDQPADIIHKLDEMLNGLYEIKEELDRVSRIGII